MYIIRKLFCFFALAGLLAGCATDDSIWRENTAPVGTPASLLYGNFYTGLYGTYDETRRIAVLLPTSGSNAEIGKSIRTGIEAAAIRFAPKSTQITFHDTGTNDIADAIDTALATNPDIIIGPVFAEEARILRAAKFPNTPALSFTSDTTAVGDGVFSMSLLPSNSIEGALQEMSRDSVGRFIIIAPDTTSGQIMAGVAKSVSEKLGLQNAGLLYYTERDTDAIKNVAITVADYTARSEANTRAKEILSAIITNEQLLPEEKDSIAAQLDEINRTDTLGKLPYDAILFLGGAPDTKSLVSFLRYYGVGTNDAKLYGTSLWQDSATTSDTAMIGAKFAGLPDIPEDFSIIYEAATGKPATRMAAMGYDAMLMAIGTLAAPNKATYLTAPSGYIGTTGIFRLRANGTNERALQIVKLNGSGKTRLVRPAPDSFASGLYLTDGLSARTAAPKEIESEKINVMDYINIPERFIRKYSKPNYQESSEPEELGLTPITVLESRPQDFLITTDDYKPVPLESISRKYIDSVEVTE